LKLDNTIILYSNTHAKIITSSSSLSALPLPD
jgi:hypothetical protein